MNSHPQQSRHPTSTASQSPERGDRISTGAGLAMVGIGLVCLAGAQGARIFLEYEPQREAAVAPRSASGFADEFHGKFDTTTPVDPLGMATPSPALEAFEPQTAVGTGPGSPAVKARVPPRSGGVVGIAANPIPNGTAIFRIWASGRLEAMITTENGVWGQWVSVAPGFSTDMRRPQAPEDPENPE